METEEKDDAMKDILFYLALITAVVVIIGAIFLIKMHNKETMSLETAKCISDKSIIYSSKSCSHCIEQKNILAEYYRIFHVVDCIDLKEECSKNKITATPTWIINNKTYVGVKSIKELKEITGCLND